MELEEGNGGA